MRTGRSLIAAIRAALSDVGAETCGSTATRSVRQARPEAPPSAGGEEAQQPRRLFGPAPAAIWVASSLVKMAPPPASTSGPLKVTILRRGRRARELGTVRRRGAGGSRGKKPTELRLRRGAQKGPSTRPKCPRVLVRWRVAQRTLRGGSGGDHPTRGDSGSSGFMSKPSMNCNMMLEIVAWLSSTDHELSATMM